MLQINSPQKFLFYLLYVFFFSLRLVCIRVTGVRFFVNNVFKHANTWQNEWPFKNEISSNTKEHIKINTPNLNKFPELKQYPNKNLRGDFSPHYATLPRSVITSYYIS